MAYTAIALQGVAGGKGYRVRTGSGAPSSATVANDGDTYLDVANYRLYGPRSGGAWPGTYTSTVGLQGPPGQLTMATPDLSTAYGLAAGQTVGYATGRTLTGTQPCAIMGSTTPYTFTVPVASGLGALTMGNNPNSAQAVVATLVNLTTSATVYTSPSDIAASVFGYGPFAITQYPLSPGNTYQWQFVAQGSGAVAAMVSPSYYMPGENGVLAGGMAPAVYTGTSGSPIAANGVILVHSGSTTYQAFYRFVRTAWIYSAVFTNNTDQPCSFTISGYTSPTVAAGSFLSVGPLSPTGSAVLPAASSLSWKVNFTTAAVGQVAVEWQAAQ